MPKTEKFVSPVSGATGELGAGSPADTQPQSVIHEVRTWDRRFNGYDYGEWGVEYKSASEVIIHNDYVAHFYGFATVYENRYEIKFCNRTAKVKHVYNAFNQTAMYIYEAEDNYTVRNVDGLRGFIALAEKFAREGKVTAFDTVCEALEEFLRSGKTPDFPQLEREAVQAQLEEEEIELENEVMEAEADYEGMEEEEELEEEEEGRKIWGEEE
jgi:ribosomal protein S11